MNSVAQDLPPIDATASEAATRADFSILRYAQCWEDADILLEALDVRPGAVCLSIASAGDNALALLARQPARVVAVDLSPAQLACLELRVSAFRCLDHAGLLELVGSRPSARRRELYARCRPSLAPATRAFWDGRVADIDRGIGGAGKFEHYFQTFRDRVLPLVHSRAQVDRLLAGGTVEARSSFYRDEWNTWRWQLMFRLFFSRFVMGRMGRDPSFFRFVEGSVASRILTRAEHALTALDTAANPYLQWILTGRHLTALPFALREENFDAIRSHLDRLEWHREPLEAFLKRTPPATFDACNLSDIFEYISEPSFHRLLGQIVQSARPGARLAYWNTLADRRRPESMADALRPLPDLSRRLLAQDKAFFYCAFHVEEVVGQTVDSPSLP
ncbi:MAG: DUF3419 family protein [Verrucomicrobiales bacterium]